MRKKTYGTVVHSKIYYISEYEYNHILPFQLPEKNINSSYKKLYPTQEQQESNRKLQNRQQ